MLSNEETIKPLGKGVYLILATIDCDSESCGVPISYIVKDSSDIVNNHKVNFNVVANTKAVPNKFGTLWESVLVSGEAGLVDNKEEKLSTLKTFFQQHTSDRSPELDQYIESIESKAMVVNITINDLSGKAKK